MRSHDHAKGPFRLGGATVGQAVFTKEAYDGVEGKLVLRDTSFSAAPVFNAYGAFCNHLAGKPADSSAYSSLSCFGPGRYLRLRRADGYKNSGGMVSFAYALFVDYTAHLDSCGSLTEFMREWEALTLVLPATLPERSRRVTQLEVEE